MSGSLEILPPTAISLKAAAIHFKDVPLQRSLSLGASCVIAGLFLYFLSNFVYNVYFHPYAKYPGPFLAKFTDLYSGYHAWKGDIHLDMWRCHQIYGDKVRYAPNRLNVNTVTGLKSIYS